MQQPRRRVGGKVSAEVSAESLYAAARAGEVQTYLRRAGAELSATDQEGRTALHLAARGGDVASIRRLLAAGADPCAVDGDGNTAEQIARGRRARVWNRWVDEEAKAVRHSRIGGAAIMVGTLTVAVAGGVLLSRLVHGLRTGEWHLWPD